MGNKQPHGKRKRGKGRFRLYFRKRNREVKEILSANL